MEPIRRDIDLVFDGVDLRAYSETHDGKEYKILGGTASSTAMDLYQSIIGPACQAKMLEKLRGLAAGMATRNSGLTAWLNHSYQIPEDTFGAFIDAKLAVRTNGTQEFIDLDVKCRVLDSNPRAVAAWEQVKEGIRHGWSIGAVMTAGHWASDDPESDDYLTLIIDDLDLLEISLVGIPANQRAWCRGAEDLKAKAVATAEEIAREAKERPKELAQRFGVRQTRLERHANPRSALVRSLVLRSLVEAEDNYESTDAVIDGVANSETTSPITREAEPVEFNGQVEVAVIQYAAEEPEEGEELAQEEAALQVAVAKEEAGENTEPPAEPEKKSAHPDFIPFGRAFEPTELAKQLREMGKAAPDYTFFDHAAEAVDILALAAQAQQTIAKGVQPDDFAVQLSSAIGYCAEAVGHGLCIRDAKSIGKAIKCLSAAAGSVVEQPGPSGNESPDEVLWSAEEIDKRKAELGELNDKLDAASAMLRDYDADIDAAKEVFDTLEAALETRKGELAELTASTEKAKAELTELSAKILAAKQERLGRKGFSGDVNEMLRQQSPDASEVKPEHYAASEGEQLTALKRMLSGEGKKSGRDLAV